MKYFSLLNKMLPRKKILIYLGLFKGESFKKIYKKFDICYGFEANPELAKKLSNEYKNDKRVRIIHGAVTAFDGEVEFNISSKD